MYCTRCGKKLEDGAQCCVHCGTPVASKSKSVEEDNFTIPIPEDFIKNGLSDTEMQTGQTPDEEGDASFTLMMSKDKIREALAEQRKQTNPDSHGPAGDITDIPIPDDFAALSSGSVKTEEKKPTVNKKAKNTQKQVVYRTIQEDCEPEQIMSVRSIVLVVLAVLVLFSVAVGAFLISLNGGNAADTAGSGSADIGFWSAGSGS